MLVIRRHTMNRNDHVRKSQGRELDNVDDYIYKGWCVHLTKNTSISGTHSPSRIKSPSNYSRALIAPLHSTCPFSKQWLIKRLSYAFSASLLSSPQSPQPRLLLLPHARPYSQPYATSPRLIVSQTLY